MTATPLGPGGTARKYLLTVTNAPVCHNVRSSRGPTFVPHVNKGLSKKVYIESYGCQMNHSDSEIVASILAKDGYTVTHTPEGADLVLLNTCSIREKAEYTVLQRINEMNALKARNKGLKVGVLGCMAERMREDLLQKKKVVDLVVGPDAYRSLPVLLDEVESGQRAVNVLLSREETYAEVEPVRLGSNGVTAFVTIMRGCDNMCAFCVVPFTRGRERSRDAHSIVAECKDLVDKGYKEVTLLGQNVDSYKWRLEEQKDRGTGNASVDFADLLAMVAEVSPTLRVRYSTSHPKDMTDKVLEVMQRYPNICKYVHLPVQSGSSQVLERMNRGYTREWYMDRIASIKRHLPNCAITTDIITGYCGETEEDHQQTLSLIDKVGYSMGFMFKYSERPKTLAARKYADDVPEAVKGRRLQEVIDRMAASSAAFNAKAIGQERLVLVEGVSKRNADHLYGRSDQYTTVIIPRRWNGKEIMAGDYARVRIVSSTAASLQAEPVALVVHPGAAELMTTKE
jgi:tRNA-2-methylthio-N6-dimethylallyladenosine synthase